MCIYRVSHDDGLILSSEDNKALFKNKNNKTIHHETICKIYRYIHINIYLY